MSWLTEFVRPKIRTLLGRKDVPENLWHQCPACQQMIFQRDLDANLKVCPHCGHHLRATARDRLVWTFDDGAFTIIATPKVPQDPLRFRDQKRYSDRLKEARDKTKLEDALLVGHGLLGGRKAVVGSMGFGFIGGSVGARPSAKGSSPPPGWPCFSARPSSSSPPLAGRGCRRARSASCRCRAPRSP